MKMLKTLAFFIAALVSFCAADNQITLINRCNEKIWIAGRPNVKVNSGALSPGGSTVATVPSRWSGILWGKTRCDTQGGCDSDAPSVDKPCTQAEFSFNANMNYDYYDVSNVDGANLPMSIEPSGALNPPPNAGNTCKRASCLNDLRRNCPGQLQYNSKGRTAGCRNDRSSVARNFYLGQCPNAYAFEKDDRNTFVCRAASPGNAQYRIVFCP